MQILIQGEQRDIPVTSLILESDTLHPDMMKKFHCSDCGKFIFQYIGNLIMIVPGETRALVPVFDFCKQCKKRYLITSVL